MKRILFPIVLLVTLSSSAANPLSGISREVPKAWPCGELSRADDRPVYATKWETRVCAVSADGRLSEKVPAGTKRVYANFIFGDELQGAYYRDALVSSTAVTVE